MAKLQTKSDNINPFGGLFSIFKTFDKSGVRNVIDRTLGPRGTLLAFSHGDIFASLLGCYLTGGDCIDLDFDHQCIPAGKKDAEYSYKKAFGYFPGVASVGGLIVGIENRDGNTNVKFHQKDTLERILCVQVHPYQRLGQLREDHHRVLQQARSERTQFRLP